MNALQQLSNMTVIVADTGDLTAIKRIKPVDATTNPSLITKALVHPDKQALLSKNLNAFDGDIDKVIDALTIQIGCDILKLIQGRVSTEVDARLSYDTEKTVAKSLQFIEAYQQHGVDTDRILIKIAATWQGIKAAELLEKQSIHCNLTLLFGLHQAQACADAGVTLISPFVGRILDWQKQQLNVANIAIDDDLGVQSVKTIYNYYKQHGYETEVMGASFRSTEQILALAGCDLLTISPALLDELAAMDKTVTQQLSIQNAKDGKPIEQIHYNKNNYIKADKLDNVTQALLPKGIDGFIEAREQLENTLAQLKTQ